MVQSHPGTLDLHRADSGHDLWAAVEAAQYARHLGCDEPRTDVEAARMRDFVDFFSDCSERWEVTSAMDQATALRQVGNRLSDLSELGLFVYWAVVQGSFGAAGGEPVDLPVAVLTIARGGEPSVTVDVLGAPDVG